MLDKNGVEIRVGDRVVAGEFPIEVSVTRIGKAWLEFMGGSVPTKFGVEVIRRADGSDPRKVDLKGNPVVPCVRHAFEPLTERCEVCGMSAEAGNRFLEEYNKLLGENHHLLAGCFCNTFDCPHKREADRAKAKLAAKSPAELYADFHRIVAETVAREAPKVKVVTDFSGTRATAWLSLGGIEKQFSVLMSQATAGYQSLTIDELDELRGDLQRDPLR